MYTVRRMAQERTNGIGRTSEGIGRNAAVSKSREIIESVGSEMKENPPAQLAKTARRYGTKRADKQRVAILLSKSRKAGAKI